MRVYRVATKGQEEGGDRWVKTYFISVSGDGISFSNYSQKKATVSILLIMFTICRISRPGWPLC